MTRRWILPLVFAASFVIAQLALAQVALMNAQTTTGAGAAFSGNRTSGTKTYSADGKTTAGTGTAVITVEGSMNGGLSWDPAICSISLTLTTTTTSNGCTSADKYLQLRGNVTSISGTGASVSLTAGF